MKVAFVIEDLDAAAGGGFTFSTEIAEALARAGGLPGQELIVYVVGEGDLPFQAGALHVERVSLPTHLLARAQRSLAWRAREVREAAAPLMSGRLEPGPWERRLAAAGVDLVWSPGPRTPTYDVPYVCTVWDLQHRLQPWFPEVSAGGEWSRRERHFARLLRRAFGIVVGTDVGAGEVERFYGVPRGRMRVMPHPTPRFALDAPVRDARALVTQLGLREPFVLYPAQLWPHKNHVALLRAAHRLRQERGIMVDLALPGSDKGNAAHIKACAAELGLDAQVHLLGFRTRDELVALYRHAACLAYPSYFGPENLPPLEAFALGCPVVAARVAGAEEQLADAALLVPPDDHAAWARALELMLSDSAARAGWIERGRQRARRYTADDMVKDMARWCAELAPVVDTWSRR